MRQYRIRQMVQTLFDTGAMGTHVLYGVVIACGPKCATIEWESGLRNRIRNDDPRVEVARNLDAAREALQARRRALANATPAT